jgi:ABC-2 type transport system permease protein
MLAHVGLGLILSSLILTVRTTGPLSTALLTGSMFLGGVYYPSSVIPSWIRDIAGMLPLTHGLRALRQIVLKGASLEAVAYDVQMVALMAVVTLSLGAAALTFALQYSRRAGTLATY